MPTKLVIDCATGQSKEVELTAEEIAQMEADAQALADIKAQEEAEAAAKAAQKETILERLGLTEDELKVVLS